MILRKGKPEEVGMSPKRMQHVEALAKGRVDDGTTPALVTLVARKCVIIHHSAFGVLTSRPDSPPVRTDTIFPLQSLTKPITATAVMLLVEDGLLGLNAPVRFSIPEFVDKDMVFVHHLLTHTSGLRDEDLDEHAKKKGAAIIPPAPGVGAHPRIHECLFLRYDAPLWKKPGTEMSYADFNYQLLGEIVRRVTGRSLADFARERIFQPLGLKDSFYVVPDEARSRIVDFGREMDSREYQDTPLGSDGVFSTVMDMAIFGQMFLNGGACGDARILSKTTVAQMTRNQIPGISARSRYWQQLIGGEEFLPEASWGYGWDINGDKKAYQSGSLQSPRAFQHGGMGGIWLWVDPEYEIVGCIFGVDRRSIDPLLGTGRSYHWPLDKFVNAVTAAVED
jgi:CubicO group peptidase (beta-lactamase class C family)